MINTAFKIKPLCIFMPLKPNRGKFGWVLNWLKQLIIYLCNEILGYTCPVGLHCLCYDNIKWVIIYKLISAGVGI